MSVDPAAAFIHAFERRLSEAQRAGRLPNTEGLQLRFEGWHLDGWHVVQQGVVALLPVEPSEPRIAVVLNVFENFQSPGALVDRLCELADAD